MKIKSYLLLLGIIFLAILSFSLISENTDARLCVWDGESTSALASNATNWDLDTAPVAGDDILFDGLNATGDDPCTWDLATNSFGTFTIVTGYSGVITQSSDMYISGYSQAGGVMNGISTKWIYCNGNFIKSSGTLAQLSKLTMLKNNSDVTLDSSGLYLSISNNVFINSTTSDFQLTGLYISEGKTLTIQTGKTLIYRAYSAFYNLENYGFIVGGTFEICLYNADKTIIKPGNITTLTIANHAASTNSWKATLSGSIICNSVLIKSNHGTYTVTVDLNGHNLTASSITVGTRGILKCGSSSIYTNSLTSTLGTIIPETSTFIIEENGNINIGTTNYLYNLNVKNIINFASDCNITNNLIFRENLINRDYGLYFDTVRQYTVTSNSNGLIIEDAVIINSTEISIFLKPLIILSYINIDDNTIGINDFYHAEYISDIPVNWAFNSTANWITFENGNISGIANITDTFYYTITVTSLNGEVTTYTGYIYVASVYDLQMSTLILIIWVILMIVFLLISLKYTEWGILGGIIWLLAGLLEFIDLNTSLGLIIISIGMFIMLYGIYELFKR